MDGLNGNDYGQQATNESMDSPLNARTEQDGLDGNDYEKQATNEIMENPLNTMMDQEGLNGKDRGKQIMSASRNDPASEGNEQDRFKKTDTGKEWRQQEMNEDKRIKIGKDRVMDVGTQRESKQDNTRKEGIKKWQRNYKKEATIILETDHLEKVEIMDIIKAVEELIGIGKLLVARPRLHKEYELTIESEEMCEKLMEGLFLQGKQCEIRKLCSAEMVVSFLNLPGYIEDAVILNKLLQWGVTPILPVRRRFYPGTTVEDGTRYLKVRFPREVTSLPYSVRLETAEGPQYYRVIHDRQVKLCRLCMSPEHVVRDCPSFVCRECDEQGHYARNCRATKCPDCNKALIRCMCDGESEMEDNERQQGCSEKKENASQDGLQKTPAVSAQDMGEPSQRRTEPRRPGASEREEKSGGTMEEQEEEETDGMEKGLKETDDSSDGGKEDQQIQQMVRDPPRRKRSVRPNVLRALEMQRKRRDVLRERFKSKEEGRFSAIAEMELE